LLNCVSLS